MLLIVIANLRLLYRFLEFPGLQLAIIHTPNCGLRRRYPSSDTFRFIFDLFVLSRYNSNHYTLYCAYVNMVTLEILAAQVLTAPPPQLQL